MSGTEEIASSVGECKDTSLVVIDITELEERSINDSTLLGQVIAIDGGGKVQESECFVTLVGVVLEIIDVSSNSVTVLGKFVFIPDLFNVGLVVCVIVDVVGVLSDVVVGGGSEIHKKKSWHGWCSWG